jgi:hypothetical protein
MRHPVLSAFAMLSFIGAVSFAVACGKDGPEIEPIVGAQHTDPADDPDSGVNKEISIPKKKTPKDAGPAVTPVADAGPVDSGAPPAGDDDDDDDDDVLIADCPQDQAHILSWTLVSTMGSGTTCTSHGNECSTGECCFVYPIPGLGENYCVPQ